MHQWLVLAGVQAPQVHPAVVLCLHLRAASPLQVLLQRWPPLPPLLLLVVGGVWRVAIALGCHVPWQRRGTA